ncbi:uncharacterized protein [Drosophila kikkawai]|uniref:Uncharacterized protein isoform X2 n=1 Tax=Drosophila kikkawai TaxID=30033 RepID=A0ABM3C5R8_DROKI|nr:uncharacterized protein LOC108078976 isoform X2 [Drosophila kikkawai]
MSSSNGKEDIVVPTVREVQQIFAEILSHGDDITWDLLSHSQSAILKSKIAEFQDHPNLRSSIHLPIYSKFFNRIWDQQDTSGNYCSNLRCCMVYVTQHDFFENWDSFVTSVRLRAGIMVTPYRGVYKLIDGQVELKSYLLPEPISSRLLPMGLDRCITPESLKESSINPSKRHERFYFDLNAFTIPFMHLEKYCSVDWMLYSLLLLREGQTSAVEGEMSTSLVVFTHAVTNSRLAFEMRNEKAYRRILGNHVKKHFDKIAEESERIEGRVNLIRSANEVPPRYELDKLFSSKRKRIQEPSEASNSPLDLTTIRVKGEAINLEDYGSALKEHIISSESFENLIICMSEHLEPEMFMIIVKLTQHFMEIIREGLWHLLKYHIPTETVLYQIILDVIENHPELNFKEVEERSSDVLKRVRLNFVLANPNSNPDFLTKCPKCCNFFDKFVNKFA